MPHMPTKLEPNVFCSNQKLQTNRNSQGPNRSTDHLLVHTPTNEVLGPSQATQAFPTNHSMSSVKTPVSKNLNFTSLRGKKKQKFSKKKSQEINCASTLPAIYFFLARELFFPNGNHPGGGVRCESGKPGISASWTTAGCCENMASFTCIFDCKALAFN